MSYITWRRENEQKVLEKVQGGHLDQLSAWEHTATNKLSDIAISPIVERILENEYMIPVNFALVFAQYLYETYHVLPADIELFTQTIVFSEIEFLSEMVERNVEMTVGNLLNLIRTLLPDQSKEHLDDVVDILSNMNSLFSKEDEEGDEPD